MSSTYFSVLTERKGLQLMRAFQMKAYYRKGQKAEKKEGSHDIEFVLKDPIAGEWEKQVIHYNQLKTEIIEKLGEYVECITISNTEHPEIKKLGELLKDFHKCDF